MSLRIIALLALLLVSTGAPRAARAQDPRLDDRLDPRTRALVVAVMDSARAQQLPTEPIARKALEGAARGADPARILWAVRGLAIRLRTARGALGARSTEAELVAGAAALYIGMDPGDLSRLRRAYPTESVALPLVTLADLVERGVPPTVAVSAIWALADARMPGSAYTALRQSVIQDIRSGASPASAAQTRLQGLLGGGPARAALPPP
ncbi:MAG TPA: hypothetical protein VHG28_19350 [Longimicrobiaceae bacterium]|nr:hypothetical protein [Longimicrobiaceae bacterium]